MQSFQFHDLRPFQGKSAAVKRPREITEFSFDDDHVCFPLDSRSLRYYFPPDIDVPYVQDQPHIDLSAGFNTFRKYDNTVDLHLNPLLDTIQQYEEQTKTKLQADVLTWRGMMTKLLVAPFDMFGEFKMLATCFEGTIYIEEDKMVKAVENEVANRRHNDLYPAEQMQYWGYKFETLATLPRPWADCGREEIENREFEVVSNYAQYCSVVRTGIGNHSIVIGGEVDAVIGCKPDDPADPVPYVELKTSEDFYGNDQKAAKKFERKMCRFWAQSFLLGVPKIVVGFRNKDGFLQRLEAWDTLDIPSFVKRQGMQTWDGNTCINFAAAFLDYMKQQVTGEGTWTIERKKGAKEILLLKISEEYDRKIISQRFRRHRENFSFEDS
ncbi:hypothetical protein DOTSEDRAFT_174304 [Dothistroma septosporum NZE10]|uniref:Decapping nuclease n=1 Tax=Dothistroma septosporum (strain NZE10 / CBS 128990) TaxID=675120 RepID=M2YNB4_DOTSN|nr:hypothetical protein DOTSEDRAFT_174304 [Dothistroma septosporum NZE10]